jgi:hypothetical protein
MSFAKIPSWRNDWAPKNVVNFKVVTSSKPFKNVKITFVRGRAKFVKNNGLCKDKDTLSNIYLQLSNWLFCSFGKFCFNHYKFLVRNFSNNHCFAFLYIPAPAVVVGRKPLTLRWWGICSTTVLPLLPNIHCIHRTIIS